MSNRLKISVIVATYNMPHWLEKVIWGYENQTYKDFELIIADDGSREDTTALINNFKSHSPISIQHLWHPDEGYRRQTILNSAILAANHEYILFTDGDCIPREDFVQTHVKFAEEGRFLSGGYCKLPMPLSELISKEDIITQRCFDPDWLIRNGLEGSSQKRKLSAKGKWADFLDFLTPANASFNNCNTSAWKKDLLEVNGYDERMQYGGPDREIGERLENKGIKGKQIRHRAICLHLDHARGYKTQESLDKNIKIRENTRKNKVIKTPFGIKKES